MGRAILGVLAGLATMFVAIMLIEFLGHQVYPPPPGLNPMVTEDLAAIMASQPVAAKLFVVVAWVVGAFAGGWVAARVSPRWPRALAVCIALVVMAGVAGMIFQLPDHPRWMAILGLLLPIPAALLGARIARPRPATPGP
jgi:MFS family permease